MLVEFDEALATDVVETGVTSVAVTLATVVDEFEALASLETAISSTGG